MYDGSFEDGAYRMEPIPPGNTFEAWEVFDASSERKTVWYRRCIDHVAEARLGGPVGGSVARVTRVQVISAKLSHDDVGGLRAGAQVRTKKARLSTSAGYSWRPPPDV